tara:strand:- start:1167 stop:1859 length:693 start_codon:yes stop_codon:yes gene_type:complete
MEINKNLNDDILILVPVFNESENIIKLIKELRKYFKNILVIDDGSIDDTLYLLNKNNINNLSHIINLGQGAALDTGLNYFINYTNFKYVITFDGDGQHQPIDAHKLSLEIRSGNYDAIIGSRFIMDESKNKIPFIKRITLNLAKIYERVFYGIVLSDAHNGLRILERFLVLDSILPIKSCRMNHATELSAKIFHSNLKFIEYPVFIKYKGKKSQSPINAINILINKIFYH